MKRLYEKNGFTLVELSIVLVIIALFLSMVISVGASRIEVQRIKSTNERIKYILKSTDQYVRNFGHLPCPADPTDLVTDSSFGEGTGTNGNNECTAANLLGDSATNGQVVAGMIPFETIGLSSAVVVDGWGNRFTYVVDEELTYVGTDGTDGYSDVTLPTPTLGDIIIQNANAENIATNAAFAIISHGPNGFGAYSGKGGAQITPTSGSNEEDENADGDGTFVQIFQTNTFDDIVVYRNKWQLAQ